MFITCSLEVVPYRPETPLSHVWCGPHSLCTRNILKWSRVKPRVSKFLWSMHVNLGDKKSKRVINEQRLIGVLTPNTPPPWNPNSILMAIKPMDFLPCHIRMGILEETAMKKAKVYFYLFYICYIKYIIFFLSETPPRICLATISSNASIWKYQKIFALNHIYLKSVHFLVSFQNILYINLYLEIKKTTLFVKYALVVSLCERYWYKHYAEPI